MRKSDKSHYYLLLSSLVLTYILFMPKWFMWWGGGSFGYRMLVDITPAMSLLLIPVFPAMWKRIAGKVAIVVLVFASFFINFLGAEYYNFYWDSELDPRDVSERLWEWRDSPIPFLFTKMLAAEFKVYTGKYDPELPNRPPVPRSYFRYIAQQYLFFLTQERETDNP